MCRQDSQLTLCKFQGIVKSGVKLGPCNVSIFYLSELPDLTFDLLSQRKHFFPRLLISTHEQVLRPLLQF